MLLTDGRAAASGVVGRGSTVHSPWPSASRVAVWEAVSGATASAVHMTGNASHPAQSPALQVLEPQAVVRQLPAAVPADCVPPSAVAAGSGGAVRSSEP